MVETMTFAVLILIGIVAIWPAVMIIGELAFQLGRLLDWWSRK
jgi:hypothetical protein